MSKVFSEFARALQVAKEEAKRAGREVSIVRTGSRWEISFIPSVEHKRCLCTLNDSELEELRLREEAETILSDGAAWGMSFEDALREAREWSYMK